MFEKILVALDDSPRAPAVLATADALGARFSATLYPLRVVFFASDLLPAPGEEVTASARAEVEALLAGGARAAKLAEPVVHVSLEEPWRAILEVAEELAVDMIVLGSHGYGGLDRILGTTAAQVANRAPCDVHVVHARRR
jgi:nucleotide-binding universal stress UspA family protein